MATRAGRRRFVAAAVGAVVAFAVFGLFTSLAPNFLAATLGHHSHALAGATAFLVFAAGALSQILLARLGTRGQTAVGVALLPAGLALVTWRPGFPTSGRSWPAGCCPVRVPVC